MSYQELHIYFLEQLDRINDKRRENISDNCIGYLSDLLLSSTKNDFLFENSNKKYLVDLYKKSLESSGKKEKSHNFRYLGDYSLVVAGVFTESIKSEVGIEYYIQMGKMAYQTTSRLTEEEPFEELCRKYISCISILNEFSLNNIKDNQDILRLYNFWTVTRSKFTREKLLKLGMIVEAISE